MGDCLLLPLARKPPAPLVAVAVSMVVVEQRFRSCLARILYICDCLFAGDDIRDGRYTDSPRPRRLIDAPEAPAACADTVMAPLLLEPSDDCVSFIIMLL